MSLVLADRVKVRSQTVGTGTFTLGNPVAGFQNFEIVGDGNETYYTIINSNGQWEIGRGTYFSGVTKTLTRDTILDSSTGGTAVNFSSGGKIVFCSYPASVATAVVSGGGLASDSFKTISVDGQTNVVADSSTDTLTLVAGSNITITTDAVTDTITIDAGSAIPSAITQGAYELSIDTNGNLQYPGAITQSFQRGTACLPSVDTVVYTSTGEFQHGIKLFVMVEGMTDGGGVNWDTQACDVIAVKGYNDNIVHVTTYGVTYSGATAIATFDGQWNATTSRIEIN